MSANDATLFAGVVVYFVEFGIGKVQLDVLRKHVTSKGGKLSSSLTSTTTHIITKLEYSKLSKHMKWSEGKETPPIHTVAWITETLRRGTRVGGSEFLVNAPGKYDSPKKPPADYSSKSSTSHNQSKTSNLSTYQTKTTSTTSTTSTLSNYQPKTISNLSKATTTVDYALKSTNSYNSTSNLKTSISTKSPPKSKVPLDYTNKTKSTSNSPKKIATVSSISSLSSVPNNEKRQHSSVYDDDSDSGRDDGPSKRMKSFNWDDSSIIKGGDSSNETSADVKDSQLSIDQSWLSYDSGEFDSSTSFNQSDSQISLNATLTMSPSSLKSPHKKKRSNSDVGNNDNGHDDEKQNSWDSPNRIANDDFSFPPLSPIGHNSDDPSFLFSSEYVKNDIVKAKPQRKKIDRRQFFVCQNSSSTDIKVNHNNDITGIKLNVFKGVCFMTVQDILHRLEETAESTGDKWRSYAYRKAVTILKNLPYKITSPDQVKSVKGIGNRIGEKVREIIETGKLRKAEVRDPMTDTLKLFSNVFGAGPETVKKWYAQGYRTLQDVQKAPSLNHQQSIGIKYYQEFLQRIPREEVHEIEAKISRVALALDPTVRLNTCGSYRRGKPDCGDIDILLSQLHPTPNFLKQLVDQLYEMNIITDHLTSSIVDKYMGVCHLNTHSIHRRIDLRLIPLPEWPCALLYFTGSDHFNRSMRLWARKHGYSLNEHALVQRWGRLNRYEVKGEPLAVTTEEDVFRILGLEYREPKDRDV